MRIFLSALEASANIHAKAMLIQLVTLIQKQDSTTHLPLNPSHIKHTHDISLIEIIGVCDKELLSQSPTLRHITIAPLFHPREFSIMGFSDVLAKLPFLYRAKSQLAHLALSANIIVLMDSSSFHIRLSKHIRHLQHHHTSHHAPICYYILPQIWAWKRYRARLLERYCDKLLGILPFEADYYSTKAREKGQIAYVGHPLLDELPKSLLDARAKHITSHAHTPSHTQHITPNKSSATQITRNINPHQSHTPPTIIFMPGSRRGEITRIFPTFYEVALALPHAKKLLVIPSTFATASKHTLEQLYEASPRTQGALQAFTLCFDTRTALMQADFAFICSGTATLEAALLGVPFVLAYKMAYIDYVIARLCVKLGCIGLANLLHNAPRIKHATPTLHDEYIQAHMNATNLLRAYTHARAQDFIHHAYTLRAYLQHGSAQRVATILLELATQLQSNTKHKRKEAKRKKAPHKEREKGG